MPTKKHTLICITGLGDQKKPFEWLAPVWKKHGLSHVVFDTLWQEDESFDAKLERLLKLLRRSLKQGRVSVLGTSAGGSLALSAVLHEPRIHRAVNICGRLREGEYSFRSLKNASKTSCAFFQSVKYIEKHEPELSLRQRHTIMTVRPRFGDEVVPSATVTLTNAHNIALPASEHMLTILLALTIFAKPILHFLNED